MSQKPTYEELEQRVKEFEQEHGKLKQAEKRLLQESTMRDVLLDNLPCVALILKKGTREIVASNKAAKQIGAVPGKTCYETSAQRKDSCSFCLAPKLWASGDPQHLEVEYRGTYYEGIWVPLTEELYVHYIFDITNRKRTESALRESENRYSLLSEASFEGILIHEKGKIIDANKRFAEMFGYELAELIGTDALELIPPEQRDTVRNNIATGREEPYEAFGLRKDSSIFPMEIRARHITYQERKVRVAITRDITERKDAEEALRQNEEKYRQLFATVSDAIMVFDAETKEFIDANDAVSELYGYSNEEFLELKHSDITAEPEKSIESIKKVVSGETTKIPLRYHKRKDGTIFPVEISSGTFKIGDRQVVCGVIRDISERKRAEEEQARLATAIEQASESIIISDRPGTVQYVNPAFELISGFNREEIVGQNFRILKSDKHDETFYKEMYNIISRGNIWAGSITNRMKDGTLREFETRISPVHDSSGKIINFVSVNRDVTQEVALEAQLQQAQKIQSIGTLAGGIAHDFNNILYPIIGYTEMAIDDVPEDSLIKRNLEEVLTATKRARDLVQQILTFSRQSDRELKPLKFQSIVKEAMKLLRASIPSTITISQNINNDCGAIRGDQTQIHQIIMNLCTNAYQTMEETGGQLELSLDEIAIGPDEAIYKVNMKPGKYARLTVSDTGHGMEPAVMERIFDPYFTTKEPGKGTGLGLSVVHGIVNTHGGHISASSEPGKGTKFDVYLPLFESAEIEAETVSPEPLATGDEHILLVDDENQIVDVVRQMLERLGYQVTVRTSSIETLEAFRASPDKFDLVITDLTMPNMTGDKLSGELMNIRSDIPIILCTGFSEKMSEAKANALGIKNFLMKPVIINALANTVRKALDQD